jgi:hypothetical protein
MTRRALSARPSLLAVLEVLGAVEVMLFVDPGLETGMGPEGAVRVWAVLLMGALTGLAGGRLRTTSLAHSGTPDLPSGRMLMRTRGLGSRWPERRMSQYPRRELQAVGLVQPVSRLGAMAPVCYSQFSTIQHGSSGCCQ